MCNEVPASPPLFHFMLRLVDERTHEAELDRLSGVVAQRPRNPFAGRAFRLSWGRSLKEGEVDAHGVVEAPVDGSSDHGLLELGERNRDGQFQPHVRIPVAASPASSDLVQELARRLRNLGWLTQEDSRTALRDALMRYLFRRSFVGSSESLARFRGAFPDWLEAERVLRDPEQVGRLVEELAELHDAGGGA